MAQKFEVTRGDLADKLIAALEGGEEAGGDARGRQSAALLVVRRNCGRAGYGDRYIDLRVEDHPNPIAELKRLLLLHRIYSLIDEGEEKFAKGDLESSLAVLIKAASPNPNVDDVYVDLGVVYLRLGKKQEAINAFKKALQLNPKMRNLIKQLPKFGWMELSQEIFREIGI